MRSLTRLTGHVQTPRPPRHARANAWGFIEAEDGTPSADSPNFNLSSVTDNGVGDYTVTWRRAFKSGAYCVFGLTQDATSSCHMGIKLDAFNTTTAVRIITRNTGNVSTDNDVWIGAIGRH